MAELLTPDKSKMNPVSLPVARPQPIIAPAPISNTPFKSSIANTDFQFDADSLNQFSGRITARLSPLPPSGITAQNSAINSSATTTASDIIKTTVVKADQISGTMSLSSGGTGTNLATTGGAGQVLQQTTPGGSVSVGQLSFSQISGVLTSSQLPNNPTFNTVTASNQIITGATTTTSGSHILLGTTTGIGTGSNTNIQAPAISSGSGPTTLTVVKWLKIAIGGSYYWIPLCQ